MFTEVKPVDKRASDKQIENLVGALTDPIIYHLGQQGEPPDFLRTTITMSRMIENLAANKENREPMATDPEASWYLSTASLEMPFDSEWCEIYGYVFTRTMELCNKTVPEGLRVDSLSEYRMGKLKHLKMWLQEAKIKARKAKAKGEKLALAAVSAASASTEDELVLEVLKDTRPVLQPCMFNF